MVRKIIIVAIAVAALGAGAFLWRTDGNTKIQNEIIITREPAVVFEYVTTPRNWPNWHPASKAVSGATDHSLAVGEKVTEDFVVAGRAGKVVWTVVKRDPPREWVIDGDVEGHKAGTVTYSLTPVTDGTRFERELTYPARNLLFAILNRISIKSRVEEESDRAVHTLKRVLETRS